MDHAAPRATHWESVYATKGDADLSWFQASPQASLATIAALAPRPRRIVDAGGGQSALAAELLRAPGFESADVTVLDISASAIERGRARAGDLAARIRWVVGDALDAHATAAIAPGTVDCWHDRALFHFLVDAADRARYAARVAAAVAPGGHLVVAAFAPDGPERCSNLPVQRHDGASIAAAFAPAFELVSETRDEHLTPWGKPQRFTWAVLRRVPCAS